MIALQVESVSQCWDELEPLARAHWNGTKSYRRHEPFHPDKDRYIHFNEMGYFHLITARDQGKLIGYFGVYVTTSMHSQIRMATEDTFFIHPEYRQGRLALRVLRYMETYCQLLGVQELLFSCELENASGITGLLERIGFRETIRQYSKYLATPPSADSATDMPMVGAHDTPQAAPR